MSVKAKKTNSALARQDSGQFQITIKIPPAEVEKAEQQALRQLATQVKIEGFRPGKAPLEKVKERVNQQTLLDKMLQSLLPEYYKQAVTEYQLQPIVNPEVKLVKTPPEAEWEVQFEAVEFPQFNLNKLYQECRGRFKSSQIWTPDSSKSRSTKSQIKTKAKVRGPKNAASTEQSLTAEEKINQVLQLIVELVEFDLPEMLVRQETDRLLSNFLDQLKKLGLTLEQYLQSTGKTAQQLRDNYTEEATRNVKIELVLAQVVNDKKLQVTAEEIDQIIKQSGDQQLQQSLNQPSARRQIEVSLLKRKALDYLVSLAES